MSQTGVWSLIDSKSTRRFARRVMVRQRHLQRDRRGVLSASPEGRVGAAEAAIRVPPAVLH